MKYGQVKLCSDEIDTAELTTLCSCRKEYSVSCSSNNSFVIIQGGRDVDTNVVSKNIYCLYASILDVDPPRLPSVYVTRLSDGDHRYGHASAIVDSFYFICGGKGKDSRPYENDTFWRVAKIDSDGTSMSWIPTNVSNKSNTPSPRHGHCVVSFRYKKRSGVGCFGGIDARSGKPCVDVWMMWMDEMTTWYSCNRARTPSQTSSLDIVWKVETILL